MKAPVAKVEKKNLIKHGHSRLDEYFWLNRRDDPEVVSYLEAENEYTKAMMAHTDLLQDNLFHEIVGRIPQTDVSVPYPENGYYYYTRFTEGKEHPLYCRKKGSLDTTEEIMLDVNQLAEGHSYYAIGSFEVSEDNRILAFAADNISRRIYTIYFKDLMNNEMLPDKIEGAAGNLAWAGDNRSLFYATKDESLRADKIWRHSLERKNEDDQLVYYEEDASYEIFIYKTKSRKYLIIGCESTLSDEYRFLDANGPDDDFTVFQPRQPELKYDIAHAGDRFYIRTNFMAVNFRLMETSCDKTGIDYWQEVIPHRNDVLLEEFDVFRGFLAIRERKEGMQALRIFKSPDLDYYLKFDENDFTVALDENREFTTDIVRFNFTSLATPLTVYDYNILTGKSELMKRQEVPGGYNPADYQTERVIAIAGDGVKVPVSIVYRKDLKRDGKNPCLLYGYGSYGYSIDPNFSPVRLSLLDRGFIYAIAHIRGGQEMGRKWYEDGRLMRKKNTFSDFIACGECLVALGYTSQAHLYAIGGSAGGLLIGAVINMRPDLFKGVVAAVPFVDVVTTMLDETIPLTTGEYDEWGNPNDPSYYHYMLSYSPYDNVAKAAYPPLLVTTGFHDSQVQYWEPAKWVARLRANKTDSHPLYLWTNMDYGHGGASGRFERYHETALEYAFLLDLEGIKE